MVQLTDVSVSNSTLGGYRDLALYTGVVLTGLLTILWKSEIGIYLLTLILPLQTTRYHLHAFPLGANIVDLLILACFAGSFIRKPERLHLKSVIPALLVVGGFFYYLSLWRGGLYLGGDLPLWFDNERLVDYKNFMVMPLLTFTVLRVIRTRRQIVIMLGLACLTSLAVDYSYLKASAGRAFSHYSEETRDAGPLGYAGENGLACYVVEITCALLPLIALRKQRFARALLFLVLAANTLTILFSYSREAYVALVLGVLLLALLRLRWLLLPIAALILCWQVVLPVAVQERMTMTYASNNSGEAATLDSSAQERVMLWTDAFDLFRSNPVFGTGFLTYANMKRVGSYRDTHNYYLKMMVETGALGLVLFIAQLGLFFREGIRLFRMKQDPFLSLLGLGFSALILCAAVVNLFGDRWMFIQVDSNLWLLLGCVLVGTRLATQPRPVAVPAPAATRSFYTREDHAFSAALAQKGSA